MTEKPIKISIFISYSHKDKKFKDELLSHFSALRRQEDIDVWQDGKILPGVKWNDEIKSKLEKTDIVLLLISKDFLVSRYIIEIELKRALERHNNGEIDVVPIILKDCDLESESYISSLQVLPEGRNPIVSRHWRSKDEAYMNCIRGIKKVIQTRKELKEAIEYEEKIGKIVDSSVGRIQVPGGPLNPDVINYIERQADRQLEALVESIYAPMSLILGGIQTGKTSLINRFLNKARGKKQNKTIHIDFRKLLSINKKPGIKEIFSYIIETTIQELGPPKDDVPNLKSNEDESTIIQWAADILKAFLEKHLEDEKNVFLIIDSIDLLRWNMENWASVGAIIDWLGLLRNKQGSPPFDRLTVIAAVTILSYSSTYMSPLKSQTANITLPCFKKPEILELMNKMEIRMNDREKMAKKIFDLFGGHPHLSHLSVYDLYSGIDFSEIQQNAFNLLKEYGYYWKKNKLMLTYMLDQKGYENKINLVFKALITSNKDRIKIKIFNELFEGLYWLGLIDRNHQVPSEFIKNAIKKELEQNEAV